MKKVLEVNKAFVSHVKEWLIRNNVQKVEIDGDRVFTVEHRSHNDKSVFLHMWFEGDLTTKRFKELLETEFCNVEYDLKTFVEMIENDS